jgi:hypothetical protein
MSSISGVFHQAQEPASKFGDPISLPELNGFDRG